MTRRYVYTRRPVGRPRRPKTFEGWLNIRTPNVALYLLPRDIAAVRQHAAVHNRPGREVFLEMLEIAELREVLPPSELTGNRTTLILAGPEAARFPINKVKFWTYNFARPQQDCISSVIAQVFGLPPTKPEHINETVWAAWAHAPWKSDQPELRWPVFEQMFLRRDNT